ncbi:hypothetical protein GIB67_021432 [Kingdonia uniflora]|uniref:Cyclin-like domain-containing protein n=1 Tax=Kingdonia uniflora TaxID=39325 RepID=A0A7J7NQI0_9MAGN|nr:hypothetical protein GIB67_021432 [Kingdonia uniflora]
MDDHDLLGISSSLNLFVDIDIPLNGLLCLNQIFIGADYEVHSFYSFQPLTVYFFVNYMDQFLSARCLPETNGWPLQLLSVACLSLAAKMEELLVPSLLDIQSYIMEPRKSLVYLTLTLEMWYRGSNCWCYKLLQGVVANIYETKPPKVLPQLRVMKWQTSNLMA